MMLPVIKVARQKPAPAWVLVCFALLLLCRPIFAAETLVANASDIAVASAAAQPGDIITMRDGVWPDADIVFNADGTEANPIVLRAQTPGRVLLTGLSRLRIAGSHLVVEGLFFTNGMRTSGDVISFRFNSATIANNCRLTSCAIVDYNPPDTTNDTKWVSLYGFSNRVDNCYFRGKSNVGSTIVVWVDVNPDMPNYHRIDHNYFAARPPLAANGGETIRVGSAEVSMNLSRTLVENNYFEFCNGDIEIVSNKSCENTYRHNTFFECEGALTLRHGNGCVVEGNYFFGNNKPRTGGIRVIGEDHKVYNNYIADITGSAWGAALNISKGLTNSPLNGYFQVKRLVAAFNTFVNCSNNILVGLASTYSGTTNVTTLPPEDCILANNIVVAGPKYTAPEEEENGEFIDPVYVAAKTLIEYRGDANNFRWEGNIVWGAVPGTFDTNSGILEIDPKLTVPTGGNIWRPAPDSPALGAAVGTYSFVTTDFDGQPRGFGNALEIGCDEVSGAPITQAPSSPADAGPPWMRPSATQVTWANPTNITYGATLSGVQLNARANVPGTFTYTPPAGTILNAGLGQVLTVVFRPTDLVRYTVVTQTVTINVLKAPSVVTWTSPGSIAYGVALGSQQLNASANVPGTFLYAPQAGAVLPVGSHTLTVNFTPNDTVNYTPATKSVGLTVVKATPLITWTNPAPITNGTPLSGTQLNATANVPGTFIYNPPAGTVLDPGNEQVLSVTFQPTDTANYVNASRSVTINVTIVGKLSPNITWLMPADLIEGTALSAAQLNAMADVSGTFVYTPPVGTVLPLGRGQVLSLLFTPDDTNTYAPATKTVLINVIKPTPLVRVAYLVPSNRTPQSNAVENLQHAVLLYQDWLRDEMQRNGFERKTFVVETEPDGITPRVHVVSVAATDMSLCEDIWGGRVIDAAASAGLPVGTPGQLWWVIPEAHMQDGDGAIRGAFDFGFSYGGSGQDPGCAIMGSDCLARCRPEFLTNSTVYDGMVIAELGPYPLRYDVSFPWFEGASLSAISSSALGAGLRGIMEAFGLDHDFRNDENFNGNIMGFGFRGFRGVVYPMQFPYNSTRLSYGHAMALDVNPYFNPGRTTTDSTNPQLEITTSGSVPIFGGALHISFSASDEGGLACALLSWTKDADRLLVEELPLTGNDVATQFRTVFFDDDMPNEFTISVFDREGNKTTVTRQITPMATFNHAPLPLLKVSPSTVGPGEDILLDASRTFDPEHDASLLEVEWDLDGDGFFDTDPARSLFYTARYFTTGPRLIRARLTDPAGAEVVSAPVGVNVTVCPAILEPMVRTNGFGDTTNSFEITTGEKCIWTVGSTNEWISISGSANRVGSGTVTYVLARNPSLLPRMGFVQAADQLFTIVQRGIVCTISLSPTNRFHGFGSTSNSIGVSTRAECAWLVDNTNSWITITTGTTNQGNGRVGYTLTSNRDHRERRGLVYIGDAVLTITQWGTNCTYLISPSERIHGEGSETGSVSIAANTSCEWTVINTNDWITNTSSLIGSAQGTYSYRLAANASLTARTGVVFVAGQQFSIVQNGCSYAISHSATNHSYYSESGLVEVVAMGHCAWDVISPHSWITVTTDVTSGNGTVSYLLEANPRNVPRSGTITIGGQPFTVTQEGQPCEYDISPRTWRHTEGWEAGEILVDTGMDCPWAVINTNEWISLITGEEGVGDASVVYLVEPNRGLERRGTIVVAGLPFVVEQQRGLRFVRMQNITVASGQESCLPVTLDGNGTACNMDISLCYDPAVVTFVSARPGQAVSRGTVTVNTNQSAQGRVGLAFAMPAGWTIPRGEQIILQVCFRGNNVTGTVETAINTCDQPMRRSVVDITHQELAVDYSNAMARVIGFCTLGEALDAPQFAWTTDSDFPWLCQTNITKDGEDAAASAPIADSQSTALYVTLRGPGTLGFWWKVSCETNNDRLRLYVNGTEQARITGETDWQWRTFDLPEDDLELEWRYSKNSGGIIAGQDRGWVDGIQFTPAAVAITAHPASQTVDAGSTVTLTASASGTPPLIYRWKFNGVELGDGGNVSGATTASLRLSGVQLNQAGVYSVSIGNLMNTVESSNAVLAVNSVVPLGEALDATNRTWTSSSSTFPWVGQSLVTYDGSDAARSGAIGHGTTVSMQTTVTGPLTITFWWKVSCEPTNDYLRFYIGSTEQARIFGEVDWQQRTFNIPNGSQTVRWEYRKSSSTVAGQDRGWVDQVQFGPMPPVISSHPAGRNADSGSSVTFNVVAAGTAPLSYQWQFNGEDLIGATAASLTLSNVQVAQAGAYSVLVSNPAGTVASSNALLTVSQVLPLAQALDTTNLTWTTTGTPAWVGQTAVTHDGIDAAHSGALEDDAENSMQASVVGPGTVSFWWKVSSEDGDDELFFYTGSSGSSERAVISGEVDWQWRTFTLSSGNHILRWTYSKNSSGFAGQDRAWVDEVIYIPNSVPTAPIIVIHPTNRTVVAGSNVTFTVAATGSTPLGYQWQFGGLNLTNGAGIGGATTATLTITNAQAIRQGTYSVIVTNAAGTSVSSNAALTVITAPLITAEPLSRAAVAGSSVNFTIGAIGAPTLRYQWRLNGTNLPNSGKFSGVTSASLTVANVQQTEAGVYSVVVTNTFGTLISSDADLTVMLPPAITAHPQSRTAIAGTNISFAVVANGTGPLAYRWRLNGVNLSDGPNFAGTASPVLQLNNVQLAHAGNYSVVISNSVGTATSSNAVLNVISPPVITVQPASQTVDEGATVLLSVTAAGSAPLFYQWRYNGSDLSDGGAVSGAARSSLTLANVQPTHSGNYSVIVSNAAGITTSVGAVLSVRAGLTLADALDAPYLTWVTSLSAPWLPQTNITYDGFDAARSGNVTNGQLSWLETTVDGPGTLRFWWKVSSETNADILELSIGGLDVARISGQVNWRPEVFDVPPGTQTLRWVYSKNESGTNGQDRAWLDEVEFAPYFGPSPPVIVTEPLSQDVEPGSTVTFFVAANGSAPMSYQWRFDGIDLTDGDFISGATRPQLTVANVQAATQGTYTVVVRNQYSWDMSTNAVLRVVPGILISEAVDMPTTIWSTPALSPWIGQSETAYDSLDAAQSGSLGHSRSNWIEATVLGPGNVTFWWKVSSQTNSDRLRFIVNGAERANLSGDTGWRWATFDVGLGNQTLRWAYTKDAAGSAGQDRGWVDLIRFGPSAPIITNHPNDRIVDIGSSVKFTVDAGGSPPIEYQWRFNGTNLVDGGNVYRSLKDSLFISNALPSQAGRYAVLVSNPGGRVLSEEVTLTVIPRLPLDEVLDTPGWEWRTGGYAWFVGDTNSPHDGVSCARNGTLPNSEATWMETTLIGPGTLKFWWKVSSEANRDLLRFYIRRPDEPLELGDDPAGSEFARISGEVDWQQRILELEAGTNIVRWQYSKDSINTNGQDRAWVDEVAFGYTGPVITTQPVAQSVDGGSTVTFTVASIGTPPFSYQWRRDGVPLVNGGNISGATNATLRITGVQPSQAGTYSVIVRNIAGNTPSSNAVLNVLPVVPLAEALDTTNLTWTSTTTLPWVGQPNANSRDRVDAAKSGAIGHGTSTSMETTITGPGIISFWWKVSSQTNSDLLRFYIDGSEAARISGEVDWQQRTFSIAEDTLVIRWTYSKNSSGTNGQDRAWVDQVGFTPNPPIITTHPTNQTVFAGRNISLNVVSGGTPPFNYQWRFNGVSLNDGIGVRGARTATLTLSNIQPAQSGNYSAVVSNPSGAATSSNAFIRINPTFSLSEALDTPVPGPVWATSGSGSPPWFGQNLVTHDGRDAAASGNTSSSATMQTTVTGPGTITFWWKVSSETNNDTLRFSIGSTEQARISGEVDWQQRTYNVPANSQTLRWVYSKNSDVNRGSDRAWVDEVVFTPTTGGAPQPPEPITAHISTLDNMVVISWQASPDKFYTVYYKDSLDEVDWKVLETEVWITDSLASAYDTPTPEQPQRFYIITEQ